ncbi:MAG: efflux transporter periplasmic adaptor subunit [Desulfobacterales bacterium]|nr:MAG: efflux transporter periplasmic adaptor subunit [Desulfobacterales bacterium]
MFSFSNVSRIFRLLIKILLPVCFIVIGVAGFKYYKSKKVKIERNPPEKHLTVVETMTVVPGTHDTLIHAMGTVSADREIVLNAQVTGEVIWVAPQFNQGGIIKQGEPLIRLAADDYQLAVDKAKSKLDKALADLEIEKGQQRIAREELKLISQMSPDAVTQTTLALRTPQLAQARAAVASAQSDVKSAKLDLKRTRVIAPFDALILEKNVDLGSTVAVQSALATLVDIRQYRVDAKVPLDRLNLIKIHETKGSRAMVHSLFSQGRWPGRVVRMTGKITGQSRMAGVLIRVEDPLGLKRLDTDHARSGSNESADRSPMLLGDQVQTIISGRPMTDVYALPRTVIRENNTIWIYNDHHLDIRHVVPVWKEKARVFIRTGLNSGDRIITSDIPVAVKGMELVLAEGDPS